MSLRHEPYESWDYTVGGRTSLPENLKSLTIPFTGSHGRYGAIHPLLRELNRQVKRGFLAKLHLVTMVIKDRRLPFDVG